MDFTIKKSAIAINAADARPARFTGGERIDCAIQELDLDKRKVTLSIKLLEEIERKVALDTYGSEASGKNLPFSSLSDDLEEKEKRRRIKIGYCKIKASKPTQKIISQIFLKKILKSCFYCPK